MARENERLRRDIERLREELAESREKLAESEKKIGDLERQLGLRLQNSTTSSKPPSSDGLAGTQRERCNRKKKSRRKPGGQPGHPGHWRKPVPAERVNKVVNLYPATCRHCECGLSAPETLETGIRSFFATVATNRNRSTLALWKQAFRRVRWQNQQR